MYSIYIKAPFTTETIKKNTTAQPQTIFQPKSPQFVVLPLNWGHSFRVDPTYFFQESILTEALHDTPTFEVA